MSVIILPIKTVKEVRVVENDGVSYVRTRDISDALGVKQPYEFNSDIKRCFGESAILKGEQTKAFRDSSDNERTPYITVSHAIRFLERGVINHKTNGTKDFIVNNLRMAV